MRPEEALALAKVRKIKDFYVHLTQYVVVIAILAAVNLAGYPSHWWFVRPALGWGMGVAAHGAAVFDILPFLNGDWEKRQVERRLGREL